MIAKPMGSFSSGIGPKSGPVFGPADAYLNATGVKIRRFES